MGDSRTSEQDLETGYEQEQSTASETTAASAETATSDSAVSQSAEVNAASGEPALSPEQQRALVKQWVDSGEDRVDVITDEVFYATWPHMAPNGERQPLPSRKSATAEESALIDSYVDVRGMAQEAVSTAAVEPSAATPEAETEAAEAPDAAAGPAEDVVTAQEVYDRFTTYLPGTSVALSIDEDGLGRELAHQHASDSELVLAVVGLVSWDSRDDVAYAMVRALDDATLASLDHSLLRYLKEQLDGGYSSGGEEDQSARIESVLSGDASEQTTGDEGEDKEPEPVEYFVVTDGKAIIRTGPSDFKSTKETIPKGTKVVVVESGEKGSSKYSKVKSLVADKDSGEEKEWGWTSSSNLTSGATIEAADKYKSCDGVAGGSGANKRALKQSQEGGKAYTPKEVSKAVGKLEGEKFVEGVDAQIESKTWTEDQSALIAAAKEFAAAPKSLTSAQEANAKITFSNLTLEGVSLNADLKSRLERFQRFLAYANIVTGPTTRASAMRSPKTAHKLSTAWMYNASNTTTSSGLSKGSNLKKLAANLISIGGVDKDGNVWASASTVKAVKDAGEDSEKLKALLPTLRADAAKIYTQSAVAAEGYTDPEWRKPNVKPGSYVSNHLKGLAVDAFHAWVFPNLFDPIIDAIAMYFGLIRACKDLSTPEHWHYELLGTPLAAKDAETTE